MKRLNTSNDVEKDNGSLPPIGEEWGAGGERAKLNVK